MAVRIPLPSGQTRKAWLELRRTGIGGSDASVICGMNRYRSVVELWADKTGQLPPDESDSESAYWGRTMESIIRDEFAKRSGITVCTLDHMLRHEQHDFMLANLDGVADDPEYGPCVFEAKTASEYKKGLWDPDIPEEYYLQIQHYMAVTDYEGAYIAALIGGNRFIWKFIKRDEEVIEMLIRLEGEFWKYVTSNTVPPIDGSEASKALLDAFYPRALNQKPAELGTEGIRILNEYDEVAEQEKIIAERKTLLTNRLKEMMKDREIGYAGERMVKWGNISSERFDTKRCKEEAPELYRRFTYTALSRRMTIAKGG